MFDECKSKLTVVSHDKKRVQRASTVKGGLEWAPSLAACRRKFFDQSNNGVIFM